MTTLDWALAERGQAMDKVRELRQEIDKLKVLCGEAADRLESVSTSYAMATSTRQSRWDMEMVEELREAAK